MKLGEILFNPLFDSIDSYLLVLDKIIDLGLILRVNEIEGK